MEKSWSDLLKQANSDSNEKLWANSSVLLMKMYFHIHHKIQTPIIMAADLGNPIVMKYIVSHSKDYAWIKNGYGKSAIELASKNGHTYIVQLLMSVNIPGLEHSNAIRYAAKNGHAEVVKILSLHIGQPNRPNENGALHSLKFLYLSLLSNFKYL